MPIIVSDLDNTLANITQRTTQTYKPKPDFEAIARLIPYDRPIRAVQMLLRWAHQTGTYVYLFTGRSEVLQEP